MGFWSSIQTLQTLNANPERLKVPKAVVLGLAFILAGLVLNYILERHNPVKLWENSPTPISWADMFYPPVCIFLALTGLFLLVSGVFFRGTLWRAFGTSAALAVSATVLYSAFMFGMQFLASGADRLGECPDIDAAGSKSNLIPPSKWSGHAAIGCVVERRGMFLSYYDDVEVYGVTDRGAQEQILADLTEHHRTAHTHPIQIRFFERENVFTTYGKNGGTFQKLEPVTLIRVVNIG